MGKFLLPGEADRLCEAFVLGNGFVNCFHRAWSRACYTGQVLREFWEGREGGGREEKEVKTAAAVLHAPPEAGRRGSAARKDVSLPG